ncbi:MAG: hypothetical protein IJH86_09140 [Clostridia bacterium]|nr:hypothetical protein [Clostridia bacterium]
MRQCIARLFFPGTIGAYNTGMNQRIMNRPLVVEEERINFDDQTEA